MISRDKSSSGLCKDCFKPFTRRWDKTNGYSKFCNLACFTRKVPRVCKKCGKHFETKRSEARRRAGVKFCSRKCHGTERKERKKSTDGYWLVHVPNGTPWMHQGCMKEHRFVMQKHLGRPLLPSEIVHHKNHDKLDNRLTNLTIMSRGEHNREHFARKRSDSGKRNS